MSSKNYLIIAIMIFSATSFCQPCTSPPIINFNQNTFELCPGESATVEANVIGEVGPITYSWSPIFGNTDTLFITPTAPQTWYYLEITDDCFTVKDSVRADLNPVTITSVNVTDATNCPGQPGILGSVQALPNSPLYTYTLFGGGDVYGPQISNTFSNLPGGITYFLTVENAYCSKDTAVTVGLGTNAVTATWDIGSLSPATCFGGNNGSASLSTIGGGITAPYDVQWTHSSGLYDVTTVGVGGGDANSNLFAGDWVVSVTDQEGCAWSYLFEIVEPEEMILELVATTPSCYGFSDGSVVATISGGTPGYTCYISNAGGSQINWPGLTEIHMLVSGWYFVSVTDVNGCNVEDSIFVDNPGQLNIDLILSHPLCFNDNNGMAIVDTIYNYIGNYDNIGFHWNPNPSGLNGIGEDSCLQLGPGDYSLTINDQNGCSQVTDFTITSTSPEMYFDMIGSEPSTGGTDGVVYASALGGTPGYTYTWTNLTTFATSNNTTWGGLLGGDYEIVVTDANGCILTDTVTIGYLGAEENVMNNDFQIYPSVSNDGVIQISNQMESTVLMLIYNLQGEIVLETMLEQGKKSLTLNLESGTYFYQVMSNQGQAEKISHGKIVIVN